MTFELNGGAPRRRPRGNRSAEALARKEARREARKLGLPAPDQPAPEQPAPVQPAPRGRYRCRDHPEVEVSWRGKGCTDCQAA